MTAFLQATCASPVADALMELGNGALNVATLWVMLQWKHRSDSSAEGQ